MTRMLRTPPFERNITAIGERPLKWRSHATRHVARLPKMNAEQNAQKKGRFDKPALPSVAFIQVYLTHRGYADAQNN